MKNILVINSGDNCAYSIFQVSDDGFKSIFPESGQDIEFIEDFIDRVGEKKAGKILGPAWRRRIEKKDVIGIHGTLFYQLGFKRKFYPNKRETDLDDPKITKRWLAGEK